MKKTFATPPWILLCLLSILPGLGHLLDGRPKRGAVFLGGWILLIFLMAYCWGSGLGNGLVGMMVFFHVFVAIDAAEEGFSALAMQNRAVCALAFSLVLIFGVYWPLNLLRRSIVEDMIIQNPTNSPLFSPGDMVLIDRYFTDPKDFKRGNLVLYRLEGLRTGDERYRQYVIPGDTPVIDRILGLPGDRIRVGKKKIWINDREMKRELYPINLENFPPSGDYRVPPGHYFIYPSLVQGLNSRIFKRFSYILMVAFKRVEGRVFMVYQPFSKRKSL